MAAGRVTRHRRASSALQGVPEPINRHRLVFATRLELLNAGQIEAGKAEVHGGRQQVAVIRVYFPKIIFGCARQMQRIRGTQGNRPGKHGVNSAKAR